MTESAASASALEAMAVIDNMHAKSTKNQYRCKFKHFFTWITTRFPQARHGLESIPDELGKYRKLLSRVDENMALDFFGHIRKKRKRGSSTEYLDPPQFQHFEHVSGYNSAIKYYYRKCKIHIPESVDESISAFLGGYKRDCGDMKQNGDMELAEGKMPLSFAGYRFLAHKALVAEKDSELNIFCTYVSRVFAGI